MSNSPLVSYTKISPNRTSPRNRAIDTITIHCVVGQASVETLGNVFAPTSRRTSSNYGVGADGRIGMYCEEKDRSWCTSSGANDNRAITIEVASDSKHPHAVNDTVYAALIDLVTDICKRNGIKKLVWSTNKTERMNHTNGCNMTVHRDYANKSCPGTYLYERHGDIAAKVNAQLGVTAVEEDTPVVKPTSIAIGDIVTFTGTTNYSSSNSTKAVSCKPGKAKVTATYNGKHPYHLVRVSGGTSNVYGWVDAKDILELSGNTAAIAVGATVMITGTKYATGQTIPEWVKKKTHTVSRVDGTKALIGANGGICSWVYLTDIKAV